MTCAETWTVPEAHYAALRDAAMKQGVAVHRLCDGASPEVATVMSAASMTPTQQEIMLKTLNRSRHEHDEAAAILRPWNSC